MSAAGGRQSGREFASADPTAGAQDATFQERLLRAEIPLSPRRRVQHFQCPTPSHVSSITPRATHRGDEHVARRRRSRLKIRTRYSPLALLARQRDDASTSFLLLTMLWTLMRMAACRPAVSAPQLSLRLHRRPTGHCSSQPQARIRSARHGAEARGCCDRLHGALPSQPKDDEWRFSAPCDVA